MRVIGDTDVFLPGDVAVRAGAAAAGLPAEARALDAWAARTAPWRSYLTAHLWRAVPPRAARGRLGGDGMPGVGTSASRAPHLSPQNTSVPPVPTTDHEGAQP
jgi:AraC family transcriptional regulator of adaptative response / DNA-3-methyladenine glycosylase II